MTDSAHETSRISARGLTKYFRDGAGTTHVLDDIDLTVGRGEFVSILGPSGCGKSTLLHMVAGLEEPTDGQILVDGSPDRLGASSLMPQRDLLMPWKKVADNVALAPIARGIPRKEARRAAAAVLNRFGLEGFIDAYPSQLSGGMRQRAALARTFLAGSEILLLDEPFSSLDSLTRIQMQTWLLHIWHTSSSSVLFVTHDVEEAIRLSDRVYVLSRRPARVVAEIAVDLPRPREYGATLTPAFTELKRRALAFLHLDEEHRP